MPLYPAKDGVERIDSISIGPTGRLPRENFDTLFDGGHLSDGELLLSDRFGQALFEHQVLHVGERNHGPLISGKVFVVADIELVFAFLVGHSAIPKPDAVLNGINLILDYKVALRNQEGFIQHYFGKHRNQRTQRSRVKNRGF